MPFLLSLAALTLKKVHKKVKPNGLEQARECFKCVSVGEFICARNKLQLQENRGDGADHQRVARQSDGELVSIDGACRRFGEKNLRPLNFNASPRLERSHAG
jgi:hypothetical protein